MRTDTTSELAEQDDSADGTQNLRTPEHAAEDAQDAPDDPAEGEETGDDRAGGEAARWRRKLRDSEAEVARLTGQLDTLRRAEAERLAAEHMIKPADMWLVGPDLAELLTDDGIVDAEKVTKIVSGIVSERPTWGRHHRSPVPQKPRERLRGGGNPAGLDRDRTWSDVLNSR